MPRIIFVVALATIITSPAEAHIPQRCEGQRLALDQSYLDINSTYSAVESAPASELEVVTMKLFEAFRDSVIAGQALVECVDSDP